MCFVNATKYLAKILVILLSGATKWVFLWKVHEAPLRYLDYINSGIGVRCQECPYCCLLVYPEHGSPREYCFQGEYYMARQGIESGTSKLVVGSSDNDTM